MVRLTAIAIVVLLALPVLTAQAAPPMNEATTATATSNLRLRTGPGTQNAFLGLVPAGTVLPVLERNAASNWVKVDYQGQVGWVAAWFTTVNGDLSAVPVANSAVANSVGIGAPAPAAAPAAAAAAQPGGEMGEMVGYLNKARCERGLAPVVWNDQLAAAANTQVSDMIAHNFFGHTGSDGSSPMDRVHAQGYAYSYTGENLAAGRGDAAGAFDQWWNSPGHLANMLHPDFREIGVAHSYGDGTTYGHYWGMVLGTRSGAPNVSCASLGY